MKNLFLKPNKFSRSERKMKEVRGLIVHYPDWPGGTAEDIWEDWMLGHRYGSTQFVIDKKGVWKFMPTNEVAYHVGSHNPTPLARKRFGGIRANYYLLGAELCHPDKTGKPYDEVMHYAIELYAFLCMKFNLNPHDDILLHYDITHKRCPKWFLDYPVEIEYFRDRVKEHIEYHLEVHPDESPEVF